MAFPSTFIQIHYHDRPGGVTTVMRLYARAFSRIAGCNGTVNMVVCGSRAGGLAGAAAVRKIRGCDYAHYPSRASFVSARRSLVHTLESIISDRSLPRPICVVAHNLPLGKNIALSSAFAAVARRCAAVKDDVRFFSVVHDFAQDGRSAQMRLIRRAVSWGWPIHRDLFPANARVRFIAINRRNYSILKNAAFPVSLLHNPLEPPRWPIVQLRAGIRKQMEEGLAALARKDGTAFDPSKSSALYPVRLIARKNVIEAIILCCILRGHNLLLGLPGESSGDRMFIRRLKTLCVKYRIPVVFNVNRLRGYLSQSLCSKETIQRLMYDYCRYVVSTSIAEGFGYALYEPWLYRRPVVGRRPIGLTVFHGMSMEHLYDRFDIPVQWVSISGLAAAYRRGLSTCFGRKAARRIAAGDFDEKIRKAFVRRGMMDFGALDVSQQLEILGRMCENREGMLQALPVAQSRQKNGKTKGGGISIGEAEKIARNRSVLLHYLGQKRFESAFRYCFSQPPSAPAAAAPAGYIARMFQSLRHFRLLMNPL